MIDGAIAEIENVERLVKANRAYEDLSIPDFLDRTLHALSVSHPHLSLLDLAEPGAREATDFTGVPVDGAHGPQFIVLSAIASTHFDEDRFMSVLRDSAQLCIRSPHLKSVASEPEALESLATSARLLWESLASFEATLLRENDAQALMRRVIKFYGEFYEDVAGPIFAWYNLVSGIKRQPFRKLAGDDVAALAKRLVEHPATSSYLEDSGSALRHAAQHGSSHSILSDEIVFKLRSFSETLSYTEVVDRVFSLLESTAAMNWSLSNALAISGIALPMQDTDSAYMNLSQFRFAVLWLTNSRGNVVSATQTNLAWKVILDEGETEEMEIAQTLMRGAPVSITEVTVGSSVQGQHLRLPYSAFENFATAQGAGVPVDTLMAILEFRSVSSLDGKKVLVPEDLKFAAASIGIPLLLKEQYSLVPHLRRLLTISRAMQVDEVVQVLNQVFIQIRNPDADSKRKVASKLDLWLKAVSAPVVPRSRRVTVHR